MTAWYNENDQFAVKWLRALIAEGLIAPGDVDDRSIADVHSWEIEGYDQHHFFAGIGGWSYALRLAGWPDDRPVWTGSCPCQPFSVAGKQKGFADDRHLWPVFRNLIAERRPATVFGEQVASASAWLGLVRSDLEALGYAVGAMPVQAASAGADHLRDRYWFVADDGSGRCDGSEGRQGEQPRRTEVVGASDRRVALGDAYTAGPQGRAAVSERADQWTTRPSGLANTDIAREGEGREQRSGQQRRTGGDQEARDSDLADRDRDRAGQGRGDDGEVRGISEAQCQPEHGATVFAGSGTFEWVVGADGKARRVKPGVRLLAHGVPNRVGTLRGFGNAIDPRPASAFIKAFMQCA